MGQRDSAAPKLLLGFFRHYDQDGDGTVTFDEFYHVASKLGMVTQPFNKRLPAEEAKLRMLYEKVRGRGRGRSRVRVRVRAGLGLGLGLGLGSVSRVRVC